MSSVYRPANVALICSTTCGSSGKNFSRTPGWERTCWIFFVPARWVPISGHFTARERSISRRACQSYKGKHPDMNHFLLSSFKCFMLKIIASSSIASSEAKSTRKRMRQTYLLTLVVLWHVAVPEVHHCNLLAVPETRCIQEMQRSLVTFPSIGTAKGKTSLHKKLPVWIQRPSLGNIMETLPFRENVSATYWEHKRNLCSRSLQSFLQLVFSQWDKQGVAVSSLKRHFCSHLFNSSFSMHRWSKMLVWFSSTKNITIALQQKEGSSENLSLRPGNTAPCHAPWTRTPGGRLDLIKNDKTLPYIAWKGLTTGIFAVVCGTTLDGSTWSPAYAGPFRSSVFRRYVASLH